jgi:hypothetical protein
MVWAAVFIAALFYVSKATPKSDQNGIEAGKPEMPTASEGVDVPVVFGTVQLKTYNLGWWGDVAVEPVKEKAGGK